MTESSEMLRSPEDVAVAIATVRDACDRFDHRGTEAHDPTRAVLAERIVLDELDRLRREKELLRAAFDRWIDECHCVCETCNTLVADFEGMGI